MLHGRLVGIVGQRVGRILYPASELPRARVRAQRSHLSISEWENYPAGNTERSHIHTSDGYGKTNASHTRGSGWPWGFQPTTGKTIGRPSEHPDAQGQLQWARLVDNPTIAPQKQRVQGRTITKSVSCQALISGWRGQDLPKHTSCEWRPSCYLLGLRTGCPQLLGPN